MLLLHPADRLGRKGLEEPLTSPCTIEPATLEALPDILRIEEACFSAPWTRKMLEAEFTGNRFAHFLLAKQTEVASTVSSAIVGYLCYWIVFEEVRLMNLAVLDSMRRRGIARTLVIHALQTGVDQGALRAVLEVRASNVAAQSLYQGLGFRQVTTRSQYYANPIENAVLMELEPILVQSELPRTPNSHSGGRVRHA